VLILKSPRAISRDPNAYPEPEAFRPERFLDHLGNLTNHQVKVAFGYGRRSLHPFSEGSSLLNIFDRECVGVNFAKSTLWLAVASILALFDFIKQTDSEGKEANIPIEFEGLLVS